jgi:hypothetical protein
MHSEPVFAQPSGVEVKVTAATIGSFAASLAIAVINSVSSDANLLGGLPGWLQFVIILVAPVVLTFLGGYVKSSSTSKVSEAYVAPSANAA